MYLSKQDQTEEVISLLELCPLIRQAGIQGKKQIKNRKIYDFELFFCSKGKGDLHIEDRYYKLYPGIVCLIPPDTVHQFKHDTDDPGTIFWTHFDFVYRKDFLLVNEMINHQDIFEKYTQMDVLPKRQLIRKKIVLENGIRIPEYFVIKNYKVMNGLMQRIVYAYREKQSLWEIQCRSTLLNVLTIIINQIIKEQSFQSYGSNKKRSDIVMDYINSNYFRKITMGELSDIACISADHLTRTFRQDTGKSISEYIIDQRLNKAQELLHNTYLSIANIAELTGFYDQFHFSKIYKSRFGQPPSLYRKHIAIK